MSQITTGRPILAVERIATPALEAMNFFNATTRQEVEKCVSENTWVVVGMAQNVVVKKARKNLAEAKIDFKYLEYGSYVTGWKKRLAIKLWSGWPTFPQVFYQGNLIGGNKELQAFLKNEKQVTLQ